MSEDEAKRFVEDILLGLDRIQEGDWTEKDVIRWMEFDECL